MVDQVRDLAEKLRAAREAYYNSAPIMSDAPIPRSPRAPLIARAVIPAWVGGAGVVIGEDRQ